MSEHFMPAGTSLVDRAVHIYNNGSKPIRVMVEELDALAPPPPKPSRPSLDTRDIAKYMIEAADRIGSAAVRELLGRYGANRLPELRLHDVDNFLYALEQAVNEPKPPTAEEWAEFIEKRPYTAKRFTQWREWKKGKQS